MIYGYRKRSIRAIPNLASIFIKNDVWEKRGFGEYKTKLGILGKSLPKSVQLGRAITLATPIALGAYGTYKAGSYAKRNPMKAAMIGGGAAVAGALVYRHILGR